MQAITSELIKPWVVATLNGPDQEWLIDRIIPANGLTVVAGRPKIARKSWFTMAASMCMSSGQPMFGMQPTGKYPTLYLSGEGAPKPTAERFNLLENGGNVKLTDCELWFALNQPFFLDEPRCISELLKLIAEKGIKVVVIDTFARMYSGEENSSKDISTAMRGVGRILGAGCAVILVTHLRKVMQGGRHGEDLFDVDSGIRGSSALAGATDQFISIKNVANANGNGFDTIFIIGGKNQEYIGREVDWTISGDKAELKMGKEETLETISDRHAPPENLKF